MTLMQAVSSDASYRDDEARLLGPLWRVLNQTTVTESDDSDAELSRCMTSVLLSLLHITIAQPDTTLQAVVARLQAVSEALLVQQTTRQAASKSLADTTSGAALALERLFVQLCTTIHSCATLHVARDKAAAPSSTTSTLPVGVQRAVRALAEGVFALQYSAIPRAHPRSDRVVATRQLQPLAQSLWFSFQFLLLQQLAARNADATPWQHFFSTCHSELTTRVARTATFTDDEDEEEEEREEEDEMTAEGVETSVDLAELTTMQREEVRLAACRALGSVSAELMSETVARARFRRTALRFRSFLPHMFTQAPTTSFVMVDLLLHFSEDWQRTMQRLPPGTMSAAAQQYFVGGTMATDDAADKNSACDEPLTATQRDVEGELRKLVETYSARWRALLAQSCPHGYLLTTILGAVLCALYILPCSRSSTSGGGGGGGNKSNAASTAATPRPTIIRNRPTLAALQASAATTTAVSSMGEAAGATNTVTPDVMAALTTTSTLSWLPTRVLERCGEVEWRLRQFAPLGLLLRQGQPVDTTHFLRTHLFHFSTQLYIGFASAHHVDGRQKLALCAFLTGLCDTTTAMTIYHHAAHPPTPYTASDGNPSSASPLPAAALQAYTALTERYARAAHSELILPPQGTSSVMATTMMCNTAAPGATFMGRYGNAPVVQALNGGLSSTATAVAGGAVLQERRATTGPRVGAPHHGELVGERFCRMVYGEPVPPSWSQFIADNYSNSAATTSGAAAPAVQTHAGGGVAGTQARVTSPCRFVLDLLSVRCHGLAACCIEALLREQHANVFLIPRRGLSCGVSVQTYVMHSLTRWLDKWLAAERRPVRSDNHETDDALLSEQERVMADYAHLLRLCQTYVASQTFLAALLGRLVAFCKASSACVERKDETRVGVERVCGAAQQAAVSRSVQRCLRRRFALVEELLVDCVMPCMRVLAPSHVLYNALQAIFACLQRASAAVGYGASEGQFLHMDVWCARLLPSGRGSALLLPSSLRGRMGAGVPMALQADGWTPHYPHDIVRTTELHALFLQSLRRVNAARVGEYRQLLRHVFFADPLFVAERLLLHAVGYENNFLLVHTALLHGLPEAVVTLVVQLGLALLDRHAADEKLEESGQSKAGLVATFLATLWRAEALGGTVGDVLLQAAERALRTYSRAGLVKGTHLLKALFFQALHSKPEHEERFSEAQLQALGLPHVTRFFARGSMESFRVTRWSAEAGLTPVGLVRARERLVQALHLPCAVPIDPPHQNDNDDDDDEEDVQSIVLPIGQHLLLHLCRLQGQIHHLQADLEGGMELVQLTSAKDYNVLTDLALGLADLLTTGPPQALLTRVAMPHLALRLAGYFAVKPELEPQGQKPQPEKETESSAEDDAWDSLRATSTAVPFALQRLLSRCVAMHFACDEAPYLAAQRELRACMAKAQLYTTSSSGSNVEAVVAHREVVRWLLQQAQQMEREQAWHKALYTAAGNAGGLREEVWAAVSRSVLHAQPVGFVVSYLLPRALLSFEDAIFVCSFLRWLMTRATGADKARVVDLVFCLVTAAATFFVGLTDAECTRVGYVVAELVCLIDTLAPMPPLPAETQAAMAQSGTTREGTTARHTLPVTGGKAVQVSRSQRDAAQLDDGDVNSETTAVPFASYLHPTPRSLFATTAPKQQQQVKSSDASQHASVAETSSCRTEADTLAYPLQLEAFLCRLALQVLLRVQDVPAFVHRNMLAILTALVKKDAVFPRTAQSCALLSYAVALHADETRQNYASASAVLKTLRGQLRRRRQGLMQLSTTLAQIATRMASGGINAAEGVRQETTVQAALRVRRMSEQYIQRQLAAEIGWCERHNKTGQTTTQSGDAMRAVAVDVAMDGSDGTNSSGGSEDENEADGDAVAETVAHGEEGIVDDEGAQLEQPDGLEEEQRDRSTRRSASRTSSHRSSSSAHSAANSHSVASSRGSSQRPPSLSSSSSSLCVEEEEDEQDREQDISASDAAESRGRNDEEAENEVPLATGQAVTHKRPRSSDEEEGTHDDEEHQREGVW